MPLRRPHLPSLEQAAGSARRRQQRTDERAYRGRHRLRTTERMVVDVALGRCCGIDVLIADPPVRAESVAGSAVWTARATLSEIEGRSELVEANAALLAAALRAAAVSELMDLRAADSGPAGHDCPRPLFAAVAVHHRFVADEQFLEIVKAAVRRVGLEANQLLLSVPAGPDLETVWPALQRLRSHGVRIAFEQDRRPTPDEEDLMHRLPFDLVRIQVDHALQGDDDGDPTPTTVLRGLLANERRVWVEDVAASDQLRALTVAGCAMASGPVFEGA